MVLSVNFCGLLTKGILLHISCWDSHTNFNINLLETIQRSAATIMILRIFSSISRMLNNLSLPTLQQRRKRNKYIIPDAQDKRKPYS